ncbi:MAG: hypothetical protein R3D60_00270 [Paracoccaceae bacterium]
MTQGWGTRWKNRLAARRARSAPAAGGFVSMPEPRSIGYFARGKQLAAGNFLMGGHMVETLDPWTVEPPSHAFAAELHGFAWLDHLAAAGDRDARLAAQRWVQGWIDRFDAGDGPGWEPDIAGRRVTRWINHAIFLTAGRTPAETQPFFAALGRHTDFLARSWSRTEPGLPRFEALAGLVCASLALLGMERHRSDALHALGRACAHDIGPDGAIPSRSPEQLLEVFTLLTWVRQALSESGLAVPAQVQDALTRVAPCLRTLRHADGGLARFHSGGRGMDGLLDHALSASGVTGTTRETSAMGYARLEGGRTTVIVDAARPPIGFGAARTCLDAGAGADVRIGGH